MNREYQYVCSYERFPNCPCCDIGYAGYGLKFFYSIKDYMNFALDALDGPQDEKLGTLYSIRGKEITDMNYEHGWHCINGLNIKIRNTKYRTIDNGSGVKIWSRIEDN